MWFKQGDQFFDAPRVARDDDVSHLGKRFDGSLMLPRPRDGVDAVFHSQLRRIASTLGRSLERVSRARRDSRAGFGGSWSARGQTAGYSGFTRRGDEE